MEKKKDKQVNVRLSEEHIKYLDTIVQSGKAKSISGAMVYLINKETILSNKHV